MPKILYFIFLYTSICFSQDAFETSKQFQDLLNADYANKEKSPLEDIDFETFRSLDFFPINEKFIVQAAFVVSANTMPFAMKTSTSRLAHYKKYGQLIFKINNIEYKLNVYQNSDLIKKLGFENYLFLPFSDVTNGKESYIGGRYIDLKIPTTSTILLDFNKAYNPYCAYNHHYSCPLVPLENNLEIAVLAGVKKFHD